MRLASYNIQHGAVRGLRAVTGVIRALGADVVAVQELDERVARSSFADQTASIARGAGFDHRAFAPARPFMGGRYGHALLSNQPITDVDVVALPHTGNHEPRCVLLATTNGLSVAETHLSIHRAEALDQLGRVVGLLSDRPAPRVLLGDLNLGLDDVRDLLTAAGLALVEDGGPTFTAESPRVRIDHVAVTDLEVTAVAVLDVRASDHRPLVVDIAP